MSAGVAIIFSPNTKVKIMTKQEILVIEENMMREPSVNLQEWSDMKSKLSSILNVKVKGALVRSRFLSVKDNVMAVT